MPSRRHPQDVGYPNYRQGYYPPKMTRNQTLMVVQNPNVGSDHHYCKVPERGIREAYRKEKKVESYLAEDENYPSFANQLMKQCLQLRDIPGDGNCLFRALGDQLEGHGRNHFKYRIEVSDFMVKERIDFEPFVEDDVPFETHVHNLRKLGTYVGNDAIVAFARLHEVNVMIHQLGNKPLLIQGSKNSKLKQLHIAYHNGDHYSSVRKINDNTESPANIHLQDMANTNGFTKGNYGDGKMATAHRTLVDIEHEVMMASGCTDMTQVKEILLDCDYDSDMAIANLLQIMDISNGGDDTKSMASQRTSNDSGIWSDSGTASRLFGSHSDHSRYKECSSGYSSLSSNRSLTEGARPKQSQQSLSGKQLKKMEKKQRAEERHRAKVLGQQVQRVPVHDAPVMYVVNGSGSVTRV